MMMTMMASHSCCCRLDAVDARSITDFMPDFQNFEEMKDLLSGSRNSTGISEHEYKRWNDLLSSTVNGTLPTLYFSEDESDYDILVLLTNDLHSNGKTKAATLLYLDGKKIIAADITICESNLLYSDGEFVPVMQHELGHAIGLSHSNYAGSVMFPSLIVVDDEIICHISEDTGNS